MLQGDPFHYNFWCLHRFLHCQWFHQIRFWSFFWRLLQQEFSNFN
jgi:hypothetical protein